MMTKLSDFEIEYIDSDETLIEVCAHFYAENIIAVDTEFHRVDTYFPILCLIQIASNKRVACIDPFKITNFYVLSNVFKAEHITKLFHSCKQDMEVIFQNLNCIPSPVFDTQIAANCLGIGQQQIGYANLVNELIGVQLDKSQTRTDWTRRPLNSAQLQYAAEDVVPLLELHAPLLKRLQDDKRHADFDQRTQNILQEEQYITNAAIGAKKIRGIRLLKGLDKKISQALAVWREQKAIDENKPRQWIIKDRHLLAMSKNYSVDDSDQLKLEDLPTDKKRRYGDDILAIMQNVSCKT